MLDRKTYCNCQANRQIFDLQQCLHQGSALADLRYGGRFYGTRCRS